MTRLNGIPFGAGEGEGNGGSGLSSHRSDTGLVMVMWGTARTRCIGVRRENSVNAVERDVVDPSAAECGRGNVGTRFSTAELKTVSEEEDERRGDEGKSNRRSGPVMILGSLVVLDVVRTDLMPRLYRSVASDKMSMSPKKDDIRCCTSDLTMIELD